MSPSMLWTGRATARKSWVTAAAVSLTFAAPLAIGTERALAVSPQVTQPATGTLTFGPSAIEGAGFQNVIAVSPFLDANGKRPVIAGADTAGFHISLDQGANWRPRNAGLGPGPERHIAGIAFSQKVPGRVWAVAGVDSGMLLASQDFGQTWGIVSTAVDVAAGNTFDHPRPVGRVIVADESGGGTRLWVSTRRKGLMTTTNNGATWSAVTPPAFTDGTALRGVTFDPANPSVVWVATARSGLWRVDAATSSTPQPSRVVGGPDSVEEITLRNGKVYVAGDINGFWTYAISTKTWTKSAAPAATWGSIDTTVVAGKVVAYAGGVPTPGDKTTRGLWRSNDEGRTWAQVMSADRLHPEMVGSTKQWWLWDAVPGSMPTGASFVASQIIIDQSDPKRVWIAGRSGVWTTADDGANWNPAVHGLGVTVNSDVVADPKRPGRAYAANTDWVAFVTDDAMGNVMQVPPDGSGSAGYGLGLDTSTSATTSPVYLASGNRDFNAEGEVYTSRDPAVAPWAPLGLRAAAAGKRPLAVAARTVNGVTTVIAAVQQSGVWVKVGGNPWVHSASTGMVASATEKEAGLRFSDDKVVYLNDISGLWRSPDAGRTWTLIWTPPTYTKPLGPLSFEARNSNNMYIPTTRGLYHLQVTATTTGARVYAQVPQIGSTTTPNVAAVVVAADGTVYAATTPSTTRPALLYRSTDGTTFAEVEDDFYRGAGMQPSAMSFTPDGTLLAASVGQGIIRGAP